MTDNVTSVYIAKKCLLCNGTGKIVETSPQMDMGTAGSVKSTCPWCKGTGLNNKKEPPMTDMRIVKVFVNNQEEMEKK